MLGVFPVVDEYFAQTERFRSNDDEKAKQAVLFCIDALGEIAESFQEELRSRQELSVRFTLQDETGGRYPAFTKLGDEDGSYVIGITVPLLHLLYIETENIVQDKLGERNYSRDAFFILAAISVLCHEYAHVALGHLDGNSPPKSIIRADEFSADDYGGRIASQQFARNRAAIKHYCGIETAYDFLEALIVGQASLFTVLQFLHQPNEAYHTPTLRLNHMFSGVIRGELGSDLLQENNYEKRFTAALSFLDAIGGNFTHPLHLIALFRTQVDDDDLFEKETALDRVHRITETMNQSRFLAPLRDRIGAFQGPARKKRWRFEDYEKKRGPTKAARGLSQLRSLLYLIFRR